jgi:hypothetical protein
MANRTLCYPGGQRIAMRTSGGVTYIHGDHLGSTSVTTGASSSSQRYYPFGQTRSTGTILAGLLSVSLQIGGLHVIAQGREYARKNLI